jgi:hypothetical protein
MGQFYVIRDAAGKIKFGMAEHWSVLAAEGPRVFSAHVGTAAAAFIFGFRIVKQVLISETAEFFVEAVERGLNAQMGAQNSSTLLPRTCRSRIAP